MKTATTVFRILIRLTGLIAIVLGLLFWTGNALTLISIHMLAGIVLVLSLWALAGMAAWAGVNRGLAALAIVWGLIVPILGLTQTQLLPNSAHWVIRVVHLLVGMGAMGIGERLAAQLKQGSSVGVSVVRQGS
jgi:hypothetical protein